MREVSDLDRIFCSVETKLVTFKCNLFYCKLLKSITYIWFIIKVDEILQTQNECCKIKKKNRWGSKINNSYWKLL